MECSIDHKVCGGKLLRIRACVENGIIKCISINGDFFMHPEEAIEKIESSLVGAGINDKNISEKIRKASGNAEMVGVSPESIAEAIRMMAEDKAWDT